MRKLWAVCNSYENYQVKLKYGLLEIIEPINHQRKTFTDSGNPKVTSFLHNKYSFYSFNQNVDAYEE